MQFEPNTIYYGDVLDVLKTMPDQAVNCVVTSPPYWGLRDYGVEGQLGLEKSPEEYVSKMVEIFREVRRVLRDDGTLWLNLGDSYWGGKGQSGQAWSTDHTDRDTLQKPHHQIAGMKETRPSDGKHPTIKPKDLVGIPWRCAFALQLDGWYLRQDIIWHKPNPMPESVSDRCTKAHEYIFLLSKSQKYYYDADAIKEPARYNTHERLARVKDNHKSNPDALKNGLRGRKLAEPGSGVKNNSSFDATMVEMPDSRNKRSVWSVCTEAYPEAHYATFPQDLIKPCILAGCPESVCVKCGKPRIKIINGTSPNAFNIRVRDVKEGRIKHTDRRATAEEVEKYEEGVSHVGTGKQVIGYTDCNCGAAFVSDITLDPFMGSGTTALVARNLNRKYVGIELNIKNKALIEKRLSQQRLEL